MKSFDCSGSPIMQQHWKDICIEKFERCFNDHSAMALALNTRESIAVIDNARVNVRAITQDNLELALNGVDNESSSVFKIADVSRHGTILKGLFDKALLNKLKLKPSDVLIYEATYFFSISDDCYSLNLNNRHDPGQFEVFFEVSIEDTRSLHYSIRGHDTTYSGHIEKETLDAHNIQFDPNLPLTEQLMPYLSELLQIIASTSPEHVDQRVALGFMQFYQKLIVQNEFNPEKQGHILLEKKEFVGQLADEIKRRIAIQLQAGAFRTLLKTLNDDTICEDLKFNARMQTVQPAYNATLDEWLLNIHFLLDLNQTIHDAVRAQIDMYQQARDLLALKLEEGLPLNLRLSCEAILEMTNEIAMHKPISIVAPVLIDTLHAKYIEIQQHIESAKLDMDQLVRQLSGLLAHAAVPEGKRMEIKRLLDEAQEAMTLEQVMHKMSELEACKQTLVMVAEPKPAPRLNAKSVPNPPRMAELPQTFSQRFFTNPAAVIEDSVRWAIEEVKR